MKESFKTLKVKENILKYSAIISAFFILVIIAGIILSLLIQSKEAISKFGFIDFIFSTSWDYSEEIFGAGRALLGSILTALVAILIAAPMGVGMAVFIVEICPKFLKGFISSSIELLAAIPSIIYGMWGLFIFAPFIENTLQKWASTTLAELPKGSFNACTKGIKRILLRLRYGKMGSYKRCITSLCKNCHMGWYYYSFRQSIR